MFYFIVEYIIFFSFFFFFNDTATTEIYTLSLHDALPISRATRRLPNSRSPRAGIRQRCRDRKSTRLNSSHSSISYAVFCLKKKKRLIRSARGGRDLFREWMQCWKFRPGGEGNRW